MTDDLQALQAKYARLRIAAARAVEINDDEGADLDEWEKIFEALRAAVQEDASAPGDPLTPLDVAILWSNREKYPGEWQDFMTNGMARFLRAASVWYDGLHKVHDILNAAPLSSYADMLVMDVRAVLDAANDARRAAKAAPEKGR